jgi:hypothetical protein
MAFAISILLNIFPLHTKMQDYHIKHPKCYPKIHIVNKCHFNMLKNDIIISFRFITVFCGTDSISLIFLVQ